MVFNCFCKAASPSADSAPSEALSLYNSYFLRSSRGDKLGITTFAPVSYTHRDVYKRQVIYGSVIVPEKTFYGCSSLTEVKLLDSVKFIGEEAFESCTSLVSIDLPYLVEEIGKRSFRGCTSLSNINFPLSLRKIGANAFQGCINLKKVELPKRLEQYRYDFEDTTKFKWIK